LFGQILQQLQGEGDDVISATAVPRAQPKAHHQLGFFQYRKQRVQARLVPQARITDTYSLLMTILMKKPGAIQIQTVASVQAWQTHHGPVVQRREDPLVDPRVPEQGEKRVSVG
jgi:hypothetical protein